jgi:hypothetical protein
MPGTTSLIRACAGREVDVDQPGEILGLDLVERPAVALADILDQHVDRPRPGQRLAHGGAVGHVEDDGVGGPSGKAQLTDPAGQALGGAAVQQHPRARFGESPRHLPAEPAPRSRSPGPCGHRGGIDRGNVDIGWGARLLQHHPGEPSKRWIGECCNCLK